MAVPPWRYTVDLIAAWKAADEDNGSMFDLVETVIKRATALRDNIFKDDTELEYLIDDFTNLIQDAETEERDVDKNDFDHIWNAFYDWADKNRIWIKIH